jgi:hypothetical protein
MLKNNLKSPEFLLSMKSEAQIKKKQRFAQISLYDDVRQLIPESVLRFCIVH